MLDSDIAKLYHVETKYLNRQVKRNIKRFQDEDFMFHLSDIELKNLRCQIGTTNISMTRSNPFAFTEQGVYMLATVRYIIKITRDGKSNILKSKSNR